MRGPGKQKVLKGAGKPMANKGLEMKWNESTRKRNPVSNSFKNLLKGTIARRPTDENDKKDLPAAHDRKQPPRVLVRAPLNNGVLYFLPVEVQGPSRRDNFFHHPAGRDRQINRALSTS